ncbi:ring finger protein, transmembrane 2 isoform X2 [Osmia lignaria lignaria]|uniref:RING finger and transmembrane domain-containing protein 2 isoform X2 n=1 Tax=Osmia bicornis bicornis TaxID=1437191 RepID=UPI0010F96CC2|nr:RING finger and transmembrane domain-containing protein 2 isoform X2 [Osmia bicornis bicornis]XP_034183900.1 RING finger and transmembrane domain-containing protein 2 isoform X2 [Osmia lignaria]
MLPRESVTKINFVPMADNVRLEEIINVPPNSTMPHMSNNNDIGQSSGLLMTHSTTATRSAPSINIRGFNFSARTMEHSRLFTNNISSTIQEIRPFIEHVRIPSVSLSSLLNIQRIQNPINTVPLTSSDNYVINVENHPADNTNLHDVSTHDSHHQHHQTTATDNFLNNIREAANEVVGENQNNNSNNVVNHNNNNNIDENPTEGLQISSETRALLGVFQKYIPFVSILLTKGLYDHRAGILNFIVLLVTFNHANNVVKREIAKQHNKSWISLLVITCYIIACIVFINFEYDIYLFSSYTQPPTIWELLWSVLVTDFILKLITVVCKVVLTCIPLKLLALRRRGKCYLMVEATSQLYRCIAPIQPWLYYLFEAYQGPEKILGVCFAALYGVSKRNDLLSRIKLFYMAIWNLFQNASLGVTPSKDQIAASGGICAICHEEYSMPIKLYCKHIFCEACVLTWLDRERSCPLCRAEITDDPIYRDGHTTHFIQLY